MHTLSMSPISVQTSLLNLLDVFHEFSGHDADKLNKRKSADRNLWTIGVGVEGLNNFTTSNKDELKALLFPKNVYPTTQSAPTDTEVENFINFIRGDDVFDEDGDIRQTSLDIN